MDNVLSDLFKDVIRISKESKSNIYCSENEILTYQELAISWNCVKENFQSINIDGQKRIGILCRSKKNALIAIGAIILSDNICVPLDINAPIRRTIDIIKNLDLDALVLDSPLVSEWSDYLKDYKIIEWDNFVLFHKKIESGITTGSPGNLGYILNTSGSTGMPKGVMVTYQNAYSFVDWADSTFEFSEKDVFASISPFHFDLSIFDVFVCLKNNASMVLFEPQETQNPRIMASLLAKLEVTVVYATPSFLCALTNFGKIHKYDHSAIRYVLFAGEVFPVQILRKLKEYWIHPEYYNLYGPTETNVCTWFEVPVNISQSRTEPFPIGKDCNHVTTMIDGGDQEGELLVTGRSVTPGYWGMADGDNTHFHMDERGRKWYRTGDIVRQNDEGDYIFVGRKDRMVKRRGYRIELDEIEKNISGHPDILKAATVSIQLENHQVYIASFCQLKTDLKQELNANTLRNYCLQLLPVYMLPDRFVFLDSIPLTSTQKTNYQALALSLKDQK